MIRLKRYVAALASVLIVLVVGHFYVNRAISLSSVATEENSFLTNERTIKFKDNPTADTTTKSLVAVFPGDQPNPIKKNETVAVFPQRQLVASSDRSNEDSGIKAPAKQPITNTSIARNPSAKLRYQPPGVFPLGIDVRPFFVDPLRYAIRSIRIRLLVELYGPQKLREAKQKGGGEIILPEIKIPKKEIAIFTYWRSGSSFLGDLINHYPATFYHFEPLHALTLNSAVSTPEQEVLALRMIHHLLRCEYDQLGHYLAWVSQKNNQFLLRHNHRLWGGCRMRTKLCFDPKFLSAICKEHPLQLVKLVRLRLESTRQLLQENPELKVIYLIRDPRGVFSSRLGLDWCNASTDCIEPRIFCDTMRQDLAVAKELKQEFPTRFTALRFEDLALEPKQRTEELFEFLDLPMHKHVAAFLRTNTEARGGEDLGGPYSTRRNSKSTAFKWRQKLSFDKVQEIQNTCSDIIKDIGFSLISNETEMKNEVVWAK